MQHDSALQAWFNVEMQQSFASKKVIEKREKPVKQQQPEKCHMKKCMKRESKVATSSHESQPAAAIVEVGATHQASYVAFLQTPALTIAEVHLSCTSHAATTFNDTNSFCQPC